MIRSTEQDHFMGLRVEELFSVAENIREKGWPAHPPLLRA